MNAKAGQPPAVEYGLSLGGNLGDRLEALRAARDSLTAHPALSLEAVSPVYETEPVDVRPAYRDLPFLNAVLIVAGALDPEAMAALIHDTENRLGRQREADRNAPRAIDIDMLYAGDLSRHEASLTLPHPRWHTRRFVVAPLADVRPDLRLPGLAASVSEVLAGLPDVPAVRLYKQEW